MQRVERLRPQTARAVGARRDAPGVRRVPVDVHDAELVDHLVAAARLDGHDHRVLHQVVEDLAVEDLDGTIVTGVCEEREAPVEFRRCCTGLADAHAARQLMRSSLAASPGTEVEASSGREGILTSNSLRVEAHRLERTRRELHIVPLEKKKISHRVVHAIGIAIRQLTWRV